jgi:hypothetical protein
MYSVEDDIFSYVERQVRALTHDMPALRIKADTATADYIDAQKRLAELNEWLREHKGAYTRSDAKEAS